MRRAHGVWTNQTNRFSHSNILSAHVPVPMFATTLTANGSTGTQTTVVQRWEVAALTLPVEAISRIRFTLPASLVKNWGITSAYVGHAASSGDVYDFLATPVQLLFSGAGSTIIAQGTNKVTDWANFAYDKTSALLAAFYVNLVSSDGIRLLASLANVTYHAKVTGATDDAPTVNKTGYGSLAYAFIDKVETDVD